MKTAASTMIALLVTATRAMAAASGSDEGLSLFATFFMGFGVMIVLFQLVPGIMLLVGMLKGIFASSGKTSEAAVTTSKQ